MMSCVIQSFHKYERGGFKASILLCDAANADCLLNAQPQAFNVHEGHKNNNHSFAGKVGAKLGMVMIVPLVNLHLPCEPDLSTLKIWE